MKKRKQRTDKGKSHKKGEARKPHVYKEKNENGKNSTRPIKYGERFVLRQLNIMIRELNEDKPIIGHYNIITKWELFATKSFTPELFSRWVEKFRSNKKITHAFERIETILKGRAWSGGMRGILNASFTKFHLINNYAAKDSVDITGQMQHTLMLREIIRKSQEGEE